MSERDQGAPVDSTEISTALFTPACEAELIRRDGDAEEACKVAEEALREADGASLRIALGLAKLDLGDEVAARAAFEHAFSLLELTLVLLIIGFLWW